MGKAYEYLNLIRSENGMLNIVQKTRISDCNTFFCAVSIIPDVLLGKKCLLFPWVFVHYGNYLHLSREE